jgi:preprotein translocase YajC subunit
MLVLAQAGNPSNQSLGGPAPTGSLEATPGIPTAGTAPLGPTSTPASPPPGFGFLWIIVAVFAFMIFMQWRTGKADKKKRQDLMESLGKGDMVQLIGGEIGTVTDIRDAEVVIKFEEGKVRYVKSAIQTVLKPAKPKDGAIAAIETKDAKKEIANA